MSGYIKPCRRPWASWLAVALCAFIAACSSNPAKQPAAPADTTPVTNGSHPVVAVATRMLGVPYRYGGTNPNGFDCSGLVYYAYRQTGVQLPRTTREQRRHARSIPLAHLQPGDLLFFKQGKRTISHVGIYSGDRRFIHAPSSGKRVSYAYLDNPYWSQRLVAAGRYR